MKDKDLYYKIYMLTKLFYKMAHNMPKEYKYSLGQEIISLSWNCLDKYFEVNSLENNQKLPEIIKMKVCFNKLRSRLRMASEVNIISQKHFSFLEEKYVLPISKQIGGWQKWGCDVK